jgi:hypothetical protein
VSDIPLKTRVYTLLLVLTTAAAFAIVVRRGYQGFATNLLITAGILLVMIVIAEVLDVSFPQGGQTFNVSVSAAFCFAAGLTAGPLLGGIVVALAHAVDGAIARRQPIKIIVNSFGLGLSTIVSSVVYFELAEPGRLTISSSQNVLAAVLAAAISRCGVSTPLDSTSSSLPSRLSAVLSRCSFTRTRYLSSCSSYRCCLVRNGPSRASSRHTTKPGSPWRDWPTPWSGATRTHSDTPSGSLSTFA